MNVLLKTLSGYQRRYLRQDLLSGVVIAAVSIPISMGYAQIAGLPAAYGLYGSVLPVILFALFSTSPQFIFGVDAAPAAMVGSMVAGLGIPLGSEGAIAMVPLLAFYTGVWLLLFALLKAGKVLNFISAPVMGGFISGICCTIILMQTPKLLGGTAGTGELPELTRHFIAACGEIHWLSLALGLAALGILLAGKRLFPKFPMAIAIMALGAVCSVALDLPTRGVATLAAVEPGLPPLRLPDLRLLSPAQALGSTLPVAVVIMAETLLAENSFALRGDYTLRDNREILTFSLSNFASALVQSAFYGGYFLIAIPASLVIKKTSYKIAILMGLTLYIVGCTLFFPASHMATYTMFLAAIFAIAIGLSFLETAANTYSSMIGPKAYATLRLNISQTFYPIGAAAGILLGKYLVFSEGESLEKQMAGMNAEQIHNFKVLMLENTLEPYKYMIMVLVVVMVLFLLTRFPTCKVAQTASHKRPSAMDTLRYLASNARFRRGIVAQFLYVGMQVAVWSFTIRLALELGDINERDASTFMVYSFACFFIGKFIANILMTRFNPEKVLILYSIIGALFLVYVALAPSFSAVYVAVLVSVLFGPCWATIYAGTLDTVDNEHTEMAGAVIVMAIVGAAVVPAIQGYVADMFHSLQLSFLVSMLCFVYVGIYFWRESKVRNNLAEATVS